MRLLDIDGIDYLDARANGPNDFLGQLFMVEAGYGSRDEERAAALLDVQVAQFEDGARGQSLLRPWFNFARRYLGHEILGPLPWSIIRGLGDRGLRSTSNPSLAIPRETWLALH